MTERDSLEKIVEEMLQYNYERPDFDPSDIWDLFEPFAARIEALIPSKAGGVIPDLDTTARAALAGIELAQRQRGGSRRQPYLEPADVETLRNLEMQLHGYIVDWTPERNALRAIIAKLEAK